MDVFRSVAVVGIDAIPLTVEADVAPGLPRCSIVGLPDTAVHEAKERVRSALHNSGLPYPRGAIVVNLAPADVRKQGPSFDVPIALAILAALGELPEHALRGSAFLGELGLDGCIRPVRGVLPCALRVRREGWGGIVVPKENGAEAALVQGITVMTAGSLKELVAALRGEVALAPAQENLHLRVIEENPHDLANVRGQHAAKRALTLATAGGHNLLLEGPPGSGKTLLAQCIPGILPALSEEEALEVTAIHSVAGVLPQHAPLLCARPFRAPHHTASGPALVGGGTNPRPGEISLAHRGVLFLDEFPEFPRAVLETLREPLEEGVITVARAAGVQRFPARFLLVAAMNPCPCGMAGDPARDCRCPVRLRELYRRRISGPLLDRIDLHLHIPRVAACDLFATTPEESSAVVRARIDAARAFQRTRWQGTPWTTNAECSGRFLLQRGEIPAEVRTLLVRAAERLALSARAAIKTLKLARTIADLAQSPEVTTAHLAEALQFRMNSAR